jgi:hypothetical protein
VDRFGDKLEMFTDTYLGEISDHVNWVGDRNQQANDLVAEVSARNLTARLWQALRDELLAGQPEFAAEIDRLEAGWRNDSELLWEAIGEAARKASEAAIADIPFDPVVYLPRAEADEVITEFIAGPSPALILTGESGVGKTSFGIEWVQRLAADKEPALFLAGKWLPSHRIWDHIAAALDLKGDNWLQLLGATAVENDGRLVVFIDGINEVPDSDGGVQAFESLNSRLPDVPDRVRVVVTVNKASWHRLQTKVRATIREGRYFAPGEQLTLELAPFSPEELEQAWGKYQAKYGITTAFADIPPGLRRPLRNPAMMHLLAIAYEDGALPGVEAISTSDFFRKYFEAKVEGGDERKLLDGIAFLMFEMASTPMDRLAIEGKEDLASLVSDAVGSPYAKLIDKDVIRELEVERALRKEPAVEYSIQKFGAWVLAAYLANTAKEPGAQADLIALASTKFATYPPAWDAASMLLAHVAEDEVFLSLAGSGITQVRELVIEALAEMAVTKPDRVKSLVDEILAAKGKGASDRRRTALRAAYRASAENPAIDFDDTFTAIARGADDDLREHLHDTLYLIWNSDPDYTFGVLQRLVAQLDRGQVIRRFWELAATRRYLELLAQVVITIYTSSPTVAVGKRVGDLGHELIVDRLRVAGLVGNDSVQKRLFPIVDRRFSEHIFKGFLVDDPEAIDEVFELDASAKEAIRSGIGVLDPGADIEASTEVLARLFGASDSDFSSLLAAQALSVHLIADLPRAEPVARTLHADGDLRAQAWVLTSFTVLLKTTPPEWVALLEELTSATIEKNDGILAGEDGVLGKALIDQILLPLGLAYGKRGTDMALFTELVGDRLSAADAASAARVIRSLGSIGFHHPRVVTDTISRLWAAQAEAGARLQGEPLDALVDALATIRVLHPNQVDDLLLELADEQLQVGVRNSLEPEWLRPQIALLGLFNNGVHMATCNPIMRENLLVPTYQMLIEAPDLKSAVSGLTKRAWDLVETHDFHLDRWMGPATGGVCV